MAPTSPAAARADLFDLLASDTVKGTPRSSVLERIYAYEREPGTQTTSTKGVVSIRTAEESDGTEFAFTLTVYVTIGKGVGAAEAAMDDAWWAVEQLLDTNSQWARGHWSGILVIPELNALIREATVRCVRGTQGI